MTTLSEPLLDKSPRTDDLMGRPKNASVEIVIISMPTATSRSQKIERMFEGTGLSWSYFDAHTSLTHTDLTSDLGEVKRKFGCLLTPPELPYCYSTHTMLTEYLNLLP